MSVRGRILITLPVAILALSGCGGTVATPASTGTADGSTVANAKPPMTAEQLAAALEAKLPSMKTVKAYTAADDPNHLLGRPNGYTSKMAFSDSRVPADQVAHAESDAVDRGGSIEVFTDAAGATSRAAYIQKIGKALPAAGEYDYVQGSVLVRVSRLLTPDQEKSYVDAAKAILG